VSIQCFSGELAGDAPWQDAFTPGAEVLPDDDGVGALAPELIVHTLKDSVGVSAGFELRSGRQDRDVHRAGICSVDRLTQTLLVCRTDRELGVSVDVHGVVAQRLYRSVDDRTGVR
jgi:hypothetical protein